MSYNGIGLQTPRGTGTNGHISRNLSSIKRREPYSASSTNSEPRFERKRHADLGILQHEAKRHVQNRVLIYQTELEDASPALSESEIIEKVAAYRSRVEEEAKKNFHTSEVRVQHKSHQTHEIAISKDREMSNLRSAFGVREDYKEGSAVKRQEKDLAPAPKKAYDPNDEAPRNPLDRRRAAYHERGARGHDRHSRRDDDKHDSKRRGRGVSADRWKHDRPDFRSRGRGYSPPSESRSRTRRSKRDSSLSRGRRNDQRVSDESQRRHRRRSSSSDADSVRDSSRPRKDSSRTRINRRARSRSSSLTRSRSPRRSRSRSRRRSPPIHRRHGRKSSSPMSRGRKRRSSPSTSRSPVQPRGELSGASGTSGQILKQESPAQTSVSTGPALVFDRRKALGID